MSRNMSHQVHRPDEPSIDVLGEIVERRSTAKPNALRPVASAPLSTNGARCSFPVVQAGTHYGMPSSAQTSTTSGSQGECFFPVPQKEATCAADNLRPSCKSSLPESPNQACNSLNADELRQLELTSTSSSYTSLGLELYVQLTVKALRSTVFQHRLMALHSLLSNVSGGGTISDGSTEEKRSALRHFFAFGPECGQRLFLLVCALHSGPPIEVRAAADVFLALFYDDKKDREEAVSELGVPMGDAVEVSDMSNDSSEATFEEISEWIRLDLPRGLVALDLPRKLLACMLPAATDVTGRNASPLFPQQSIENVSIPLFEILGMCLTSSSMRDIAASPYFLREVKGVLQRYIMGELRGGLASLIPLLQLLRKVCHHRRCCIALVGHLRPIWKLLLSTLQQPSEGSKSAALPGANSTEDDDMARLCFFLVLRCFVRHGCDNIVSDFGAGLLSLVSQGSLPVAEMLLLGGDGESDCNATDISTLMKNLALEAFRYLYRGGVSKTQKTTSLSHHHVDPSGCDNSSDFVTASCFHFLATYFGVEGPNALTLLGSAQETQATLMEFIASKCITPRNLERVLCMASARHSDHGAFGRSLLHGLFRFLTSAARELPATRVPVVGFFDAVVARFCDVLYTHYNNSSTGESTLRVSEVLAKTLVVADDVCAAVEAVTFLAESEHRLGTGVRAPLPAVVLLLHLIAQTKHCLDVVPMLVALLWPALALPEDLQQSAEKKLEFQCAVAEAVAGTLRNDGNSATSAAGWITATLSQFPRECCALITFALSSHQSMKSCLGFEMIFLDVVLWAVRCRGRTVGGDCEMSSKSSGAGVVTRDAEQLLITSAAAPCLLTLSRIALNEGIFVSDVVASQLCASLSTFARGTAGEHFPACLVAALSTAVLTLPPEASLACLRVLVESRQSFSQTAQIACSTADRLLAVLFEPQSVSNARKKYFASAERCKKSLHHWRAEHVSSFVHLCSAALCRESVCWTPLSWPWKVAVIMLSDLCCARAPLPQSTTRSAAALPKHVSELMTLLFCSEDISTQQMHSDNIDLCADMRSVCFPSSYSCRGHTWSQFEQGIIDDELQSLVAAMRHRAAFATQANNADNAGGFWDEGNDDFEFDDSEY